VSLASIPGVIETSEAHGETTVVVDAARITEAARHLRDELGYDFLADLSAVDHLGWGDEPVAGYWGSGSGRDLNIPGTAARGRVPEPTPKRFAVNYHLLRVAGRGDSPRRLRVKAWLRDGETIASVVPVWPTADWHEREAWDMMGIRFEGHPNLVRILMEDDWEGHPLRKDYPIGGEPVRFSDAE
jgi:NADH-quinone oxidoreductase subunit C